MQTLRFFRRLAALFCVLAIGMVQALGGQITSFCMCTGQVLADVEISCAATEESGCHADATEDSPADPCAQSVHVQVLQEVLLRPVEDLPAATAPDAPLALIGRDWLSCFPTVPAVTPRLHTPRERPPAGMASGRTFVLLI